jgi:ribonuclease R
MAKLIAFSEMMARLGHTFHASEQIKPIQFARFLQQVKGRPEEDFINELMLRSMQKAIYQGEKIGHFGLAFTHYTHFTSPIRRYPDLLVHRLIRRLKGGKYPAAFARRVTGLIERVSKHCSETERVAEAAEREGVRTKQVSFMARHVGDEFEGVISGTVAYGFFVRLTNLGAEGMVRLSSIDDDYYHYDEKQYRIIGRHTGRIFRMGDPVKVVVDSVKTELNEINLTLADTGKQPKGLEEKKPRRQSRSYRRHRRK